MLSKTFPIFFMAIFSSASTFRAELWEGGRCVSARKSVSAALSAARGKDSPRGRCRVTPESAKGRLFRCLGRTNGAAEALLGTSTHQTTPYAPFPTGLMGTYRASTSKRFPHTMNCALCGLLPSATLASWPTPSWLALAGCARAGSSLPTSKAMFATAPTACQVEALCQTFTRLLSLRTVARRVARWKGKKCGRGSVCVRSPSSRERLRQRALRAPTLAGHVAVSHGMRVAVWSRYFLPSGLTPTIAARSAHRRPAPPFVATSELGSPARASGPLGGGRRLSARDLLARFPETVEARPVVSIPELKIFQVAGANIDELWEARVWTETRRWQRDPAGARPWSGGLRFVPLVSRCFVVRSG